MSKDEKKSGTSFEVKDRRRFQVGPNGKIVDKIQEEAEEKDAGRAEPMDAAGDQAGQTPAGDAAPPGAADTQKEAGDGGRSRQDEQEDWQNQPPITFTTLVLSLSTQAMVGLGELPDPVNNETCENLSAAKQIIDLLGVLEEKTKGNLSPEEERFLKSSLTDLRLRFVECCRECKE